MIGSNEKAVKLYQEIDGEQKSFGNKFIGFARVNKKDKYLLQEHLPFLGNCNELKKIVQEGNVEEAIIAIESSEHKSLENIIAELEGFKCVD